MRGDAEVVLLIETGLMTGIMAGRGTDIEKGIMITKDIMRKMAEETGMGGEGQIGRASVLVMEEKEVGIDIENMRGADRVLLADIVVEDLPGVQAVHIRGLCKNISGL